MTRTCPTCLKKRRRRLIAPRPAEAWGWGHRVFILSCRARCRVSVRVRFVSSISVHASSLAACLSDCTCVRARVDNMPSSQDIWIKFDQLLSLGGFDAGEAITPAARRCFLPSPSHLLIGALRQVHRVIHCHLLRACTLFPCQCRALSRERLLTLLLTDKLRANLWLRAKH